MFLRMKAISPLLIAVDPVLTKLGNHEVVSWSWIVKLKMINKYTGVSLYDGLNLVAICAVSYDSYWLHVATDIWNVASTTGMCCA